MWQPIETAPKDGTLIIVHAEVPDHARWCDPAKDMQPLVSLCAWHPDAGFCVCEIREPTHWMPYLQPSEEDASMKALQECLSYFEREIADDPTLVDGSDLSDAYRLTKAALAKIAGEK